MSAMLKVRSSSSARAISARSVENRAERRAFLAQAARQRPAAHREGLRRQVSRERRRLTRNPPGAVAGRACHQQRRRRRSRSASTLSSRRRTIADRWRPPREVAAPRRRRSGASNSIPRRTGSVLERTVDALRYRPAGRERTTPAAARSPPRRHRAPASGPPPARIRSTGMQNGPADVADNQEQPAAVCFHPRGDAIADHGAIAREPFKPDRSDALDRKAYSTMIQRPAWHEPATCSAIASSCVCVSARRHAASAVASETRTSGSSSVPESGRSPDRRSIDALRLHAGDQVWKHPTLVPRSPLVRRASKSSAICHFKGCGPGCQSIGPSGHHAAAREVLQ